jgi:SAM-dependent methyltransferase
LAEQFVDGHYGSLRGQVRTHVIHQHLCAHLCAPPARIIDVGGGAGNQSFPLARLGYHVIILDPSEAMLERAAKRLSAEVPEVASRVKLVRSDGESAVSAVGGEQFDAVLCHGVLMYLEDPKPLVARLSELASPGGVVSIVAKNVNVLAVRPALAGDWAGALAAFDSDRQINGLGVDTRGDSVSGLSDLLVEHDVDPIAWYGVRLFTDGWAPDRPAADPEDLVFQVELEASRRDPYRQFSRLFHLLGCRRLAERSGRLMDRPPAT